ncbi:MAG: heterodisulfide reductase-related iron-sulfur binding cluster [Promethearchaeota archaeon]
MVLFPGCVITYRLPFIEVSIRRVLDYLGISYAENSKFSCCPDPNGIKNSNKLLFSITAARNLALAEQKNQAILTPCNGCFTTLKKVKGEIEEDHHFKRKMNSYLDKIDIEVQGKCQVFHMVEFFSKFMREKVRDNLKYPLTGLKVAVHYGCHFLRPSNKVQLDDPLKPMIFDDLIRDLGAQSVDYDLKMECCGGSLERAGKPSLSLEIINAKLGNMKEKDVDCIVVCCPQCYIQFDHLQQELKKLDYKYDIPVLYYSELLCIALGIDIQEVIRKHHRTNVDLLFEKVKIIEEKNEEIRKYFDLNFLLKCYSCGACDNDCILSKMTDFSSNKIIGNLLKGKIDDVISDPSIWMCLDCYLCYELCPMRVGLIEIFTILRNLAAERGSITEGYAFEFNSFYQKGTIGMLSKAARKRVGLEFNKPDVGDLKELFNSIGREAINRDS